jgi:oxygen-independent coproporphyrinogen-3 oxidase
MAGIYIHIPFCKKACHYCDFHFSTSPVHKDQMVRALRSELILKKDYVGTEQIETIYFGGGTPSVLSADELGMLIHEITEYYPVSASPEITLEANPDDLSPQKVKELRQIPVNRFSLGIQSFFEEDLKWMNRAHNAAEAHGSIKRVQDAGFENITADLIYGFPLLSDEKWEYNVRQLIELQIPHISSYAMTVEPATALAAHIKQGVQKPMNESQSASQFMMLMEELAVAGFEHYEISNFAKPGWHSKHNSNYWEGISYIGIGPSAHSYNGESRQWNVSNNMKYISALEGNKIPFEIEHLTMANRINEYIMTSLRTSKGMDLDLISQRFHNDYNSQILESLDPFFEKEWVIINDRKVTLSKQGKLFADHIASELFVEFNS